MPESILNDLPHDILAMNSSINFPWIGRLPTSTTQSWVTPYLSSLAVVLLALFLLHRRSDNGSKLPLVNPRRPFELTDARVKMEFITNARAILDEGLKKYPDKPFKVVTDCSHTIVLPNRYADEVRNLPALSFEAHMRKHFHSDLASFKVASPAGRESQLSKSVVQKQLTQRLANVTKPLSDECTATLRDVLTDDTEWHEVSPLMGAVLTIVARLTSKVFLGDELCRNEDWLRLTTNYTMTFFTAVVQVRMWPVFLRPIVQWFLPSCRESRKKVQEARDIIEPVLRERRQLRERLLAEGENPKVLNDAFEWFEENAKGMEYDAAISQLGLSMAAMHTTTDLLTQCLLDIISHPEIIEPLRREMIDVVGKEGWSKNSLYNLKLLDSVIKETQRIKPIEMATMKRTATQPVTLPSDGTMIPRGSDLIVYSGNLWDPDVYPDPQVWDPYRFYRLRQGQEGNNDRKYQLVSLDKNHLGFGHGRHACPGRFFAGEEIKLALCHLLLKYDWRFPTTDDDEKKGKGKENDIGWGTMGFTMMVSHSARVEVRRRKEEIEL